ncbi:MAG: hypothetical protein ACREDR_48700, partial [Blastocatellia bacterium]
PRKGAIAAGPRVNPSNARLVPAEEAPFIEVVCVWWRMEMRALPHLWATFRISAGQASIHNPSGNPRFHALHAGEVRFYSGFDQEAVDTPGSRIAASSCSFQVTP